MKVYIAIQYDGDYFEPLKAFVDQLKGVEFVRSRREEQRKFDLNMQSHLREEDTWKGMKLTLRDVELN